MQKIIFKNTIRFFVFVIMIFVFVSCMQDEYEFNKLDDEMEFQVGFIGPIAKGTMQFDDLVSQFDSAGAFSTDDEGLLYITYSDSLFSFMADDLIELEDQDFFQYYYESDDDIPAFVDWGDSLVVNRIELYEFTYSADEKLDSITLDMGTFHIDIHSSFLHDAYVEISISGFQDQGVPFFERFQVSDQTGAFSGVQEFPLDNYTIVIDNEISADTSYIEVGFRLVFYNSGLGITSTDELGLEASMMNMDFDGIFGYIGMYELAGEEGSMNMGFFETALDGDIEFANPEMNFIISNSYGVPVEIDITEFAGISSKDGSELNLVMDPGVNPFRIPFPSLAQLGGSLDTTLKIDGMNSNLEEIISEFPSQIDYRVSAQANPDSTDGPYNYVLDISSIEVGFEFILPFWFSANNFAFEDTLEFDGELLSDQVDHLALYLNIENGLPLDIDLQVYFLDSLYNYVDYLFEEADRPVIPSGTLDSEYRVAEPGEKESIIQLSSQKINNLKTVKYAHMVAGLKTTGYDDDIKVKFYTDYEIKFKMAIDVDATINPDEL